MLNEANTKTAQFLCKKNLGAKPVVMIAQPESPGCYPAITIVWQREDRDGRKSYGVHECIFPNDDPGREAYLTDGHYDIATYGEAVDCAVRRAGLKHP